VFGNRSPKRIYTPVEVRGLLLPPPLWMRVGTWEEELCEFLFLIVLSKLSVQCRVARPVTEHLVSKRSTNFWRVLLWIPCPKRNCSPTICAPTESWIVEKDEEMSQMWPSKVGGGVGRQMVETKYHRTVQRLLPNTPKSLWKSLYCLYGWKMICRS
jgi:hypothetical protein